MKGGDLFPLWLIGFMAIGLFGAIMMTIFLFSARVPTAFLAVVYMFGILAVGTWQYLEQSREDT
ncbi:MAG: hypothetical protein AB1576_13975 [Bacillota bacterium]|jgi:hypothetical protein